MTHKIHGYRVLWFVLRSQQTCGTKQVAPPIIRWWWQPVAKHAPKHSSLNVCCSAPGVGIKKCGWLSPLAFWKQNVRINMSKSFPYAFWDAWEWNLYYQPKQSTSIMRYPGYPSKWPCLCCLFDCPPIWVAFNDPCTIQEWKTRMIKPEKWVLVHLRMASILESFTQYLHEVWIWTSCQIPKWWKKNTQNFQNFDIPQSPRTFARAFSTVHPQLQQPGSIAASLTIAEPPWNFQLLPVAPWPLFFGKYFIPKMTDQGVQKQRSVRFLLLNKCECRQEKNMYLVTIGAVCTYFWQSNRSAKAKWCGVPSQTDLSKLYIYM